MYGTRPAGLALLAAALGTVAAVGCGSDTEGVSTSSAVSNDQGGAATTSRHSAVSVLGVRVDVTADRVTLDLRLRQPEGVDPPIAQTATVTLPAGMAFHGGGQATCSVAAVRSDGVAACPKSSIIGAGQAVGTADTAQVKGEITILDGGPETILLATVVRNPAYVRTVVAAKLAASSGSRVTIRFPGDLQEIGGVPVGLDRLQLILQRSGAISIGTCPSTDELWRYSAAVAFADKTTVKDSGIVACR